MDRILNSSPFDIDNVRRCFGSYLVDVKGIIVVRLANNKDYENIYSSILKLCIDFIAETNDEDTKEELEIIKITYDRLKSVIPLENPNLTEN